MAGTPNTGAGRPGSGLRRSILSNNPTPVRQVPADTVRVPYVDLAAQHAPIKEELLRAVARVLDHGRFVLGDEVDEFEARFATLAGTRYAVAVNSGTDALVLALRALEVGAGDEVITAPNSFVASASCILMAGARPAFVDVREDYNLDPDLLERAITPRTKAILPVHLTGRPADMDPILEVARQHGLFVVEDCAQAVLAEYRGRRVGSFGTLGCFSLHPLKTLNACGDGGVVTTNDEALRRRLRVMRNLGLRTRDECAEWSGNSRLDTMQAAMLLVKLEHVQTWTEARRAHATFYQHALAGLPGLSTPVERRHEKSVFHTFVIQADRRDALKAHLASVGIETAVHYPVPIHLQPAAAGLGYGSGSFPTTERLAERILSLPVHGGLAHDQLAHVAGSIRSFFS